MATVSEVPVLSFPAILRNPGLNNRFAHLHGPLAEDGARKHAPVKVSVKKNRRDQNEGKRWVRRKDNARFADNPHIVAASKRDYALQVPHVQPTFPEPLPPYLPRVVKLPTVPTLPTLDPESANAGRFSLSLKGMRRDLRRAGGRAQALVRDVESEMVQWLTLGGTVLAPEEASRNISADDIGIPIGSTGTIFEASRTPQQLVWRISDDAFARYVVHCCARYHEVVSFSKGTADNRLTYLLRPNVIRPDRRVPVGLETPPVTDIDYSSNPETDDNLDSDFVSDRDLESDVESSGNLSMIEESPLSRAASLPPLSEDEWSNIDEEGHVAGESDLDDFESGSEFGSALGASVDVLRPRLEALSLEHQMDVAVPEEPQEAEAGADPDRTITEMQAPLQGIPSPRRRDWSGATRSASSPSRSPVRMRRRRRGGPKKRQMVIGLQSGLTFYEYLFS